MDRRDFLKACVLFAGVAVSAIAWDAGVNNGRPGEPAEEEPP